MVSPPRIVLGTEIQLSAKAKVKQRWQQASSNYLARARDDPDLKPILDTMSPENIKKFYFEIRMCIIHVLLHNESILLTLYSFRLC